VIPDFERKACRRVGYLDEATSGEKLSAYLLMSWARDKEGTMDRIPYLPAVSPKKKNCSGRGGLLVGWGWIPRLKILLLSRKKKGNRPRDRGADLGGSCPERRKVSSHSQQGPTVRNLKSFGPRARGFEKNFRKGLKRKSQMRTETKKEEEAQIGGEVRDFCQKTGQGAGGHGGGREPL